MQLQPNLSQLSLTLSGLFFITAASQSALGALYYNDLVTSETAVGSGVYEFANAGTGWSGNGSIAGPAGTGTTSGATMIDDFSGSGTLDLGDTKGWGTTILTPTNTSMAITLGGTGSGDIGVTLSGPGGDKAMNFNILDLKGGVTSVTVEINFTEPLAAAYRVPLTTPYGSAPFLAGFRTQGAGNPWNVDTEYLGLRHTTAVGGSFISGLPGSAESIDMSNNSYNWGDGASFSGVSTTSRWQGIHLFDLDGGIYDDHNNSNGILDDPEAVYATGLRYTFTKDGGASLDGANFLFSMNGSQYSETFTQASELVPEPSSLLLIGLGSLGLLRRRRG